MNLAKRSYEVFISLCFLSGLVLLAVQAVRTPMTPLNDATAAVAPPGPPKYAPAHGAYLGAALDYSNMSGAGTNTDKMAADMREWEKASGRKHALYLQFVNFPHEDGSFPAWASDPKGWASSADFANAAESVGATPVITLEPRQPQLFLDWTPGSPAYEATRTYALQAGRWGKPLFIRWAHEMNGSWYPWDEWIDKNKNMHRDPGEDTGFTAEDYRIVFRHVAHMFHDFAPNVAMVWCPNSGLLGGDRRDVFRPFYPGDDVVDWVGLDVYERGWTMPMPGAHLWSGQFGYNLTHDEADDPGTPANESVDFYHTFALGHHKPMMICETAATLSYRSDLSLDDRSLLTHQWKMGYWNPHEYGWMQAVYGTTGYTDQKISDPVDTEFPGIKAIIWFQVAKREDIPVEIHDAAGSHYRWFNDEDADYRIGGGAQEGGPRPFEEEELAFYRELTSSPYFLGSLVR